MLLGSLPHMCNSEVKMGFLLVHSQNKGLPVSSSLSSHLDFPYSLFTRVPPARKTGYLLQFQVPTPCGRSCTALKRSLALGQREKKKSKRWILNPFSWSCRKSRLYMDGCLFIYLLKKNKSVTSRAIGCSHIH